MERTTDSDAVFPVRHFEPGQDQHPHLADVVPTELCGEWWPGLGRDRSVLALEYVDGKAPRDGHRCPRQFVS